jgi:multidrug efflux pump subunit AcrA (membrane-fusion protein)
MPSFTELIRTVHHLVRTILALAVLVGLATAAYLGYRAYQAQRQAADAQAAALAQSQQALATAHQQLDQARQTIASQATELAAREAQIAELEARVRRLETALHYLKIDHRVARFTAIDQTRDEATGEVSTLVEFVELNDEGHPIDMPKQFRIRGDIVYIDGWVVKFEDKYVEQADLERGTSLLLFKRIFGSGQKPDDGYPLDEIGSPPRAYARGGKMSEFEKKIWDDFWAIANDPERARQLGIRAAHGGAPFMKVEKGRSYRILLRASGDPTIVPEPMAGASGGQ